MPETWLPIPNIPGALASSLGRVWFPSTSAKMPNGGSRQYVTKPRYGYEEKTATGRAGVPKRRILNWRGTTYKVHRLVCEAFHGLAPSPKHVVVHLNENPSDNRPENLRWATQKENLNFPKAKAAFRARKGDRSPTAINRARRMT